MLILAKLFVVGIGPGDYEQMTLKAINTINNCDVIVGYTVYCEIIKPYFSDKKFISSGMRQEKERCMTALNFAQNQNTAVICSGDAGVYAMAGLIIELSDNFDNVDINIIPGVTAALSGGAVLGAPLGHDFAVISLSDLLTPYSVIQNRIKLASQADFIICIYNPSSKNRSDYLKKACDIMLKYKKEDTVCGIVKNIGRCNEFKTIITLSELKNYI